jgi:homoserine acetyltransferase
LNFSSRALEDYHVIIIAMLGNGESSSPSNDPSFPADYSLRYQDCVNAQYILLTLHFGIKNLDVVVGFSMGGQQGQSNFAHKMGVLGMSDEELGSQGQ